MNRSDNDTLVHHAYRKPTGTYQSQRVFVWRYKTNLIPEEKHCNTNQEKKKFSVYALLPLLKNNANRLGRFLILPNMKTSFRLTHHCYIDISNSYLRLYREAIDIHNHRNNSNKKDEGISLLNRYITKKDVDWAPSHVLSAGAQQRPGFESLPTHKNSQLSSRRVLVCSSVLIVSSKC